MFFKLAVHSLNTPFVLFLLRASIVWVVFFFGEGGAALRHLAPPQSPPSFVETPGSSWIPFFCAAPAASDPSEPYLPQGRRELQARASFWRNQTCLALRVLLSVLPQVVAYLPPQDLRGTCQRCGAWA